MASDRPGPGRRLAALARTLALALVVVLPTCKDLDDNDLLSALAANPPDDEGGGAGDDGGDDGGGRGACLGSADRAILPNVTHPTVTALDCGLNQGCGADGGCIEGCVVTATGLSRGCARCFADAALCAFEDCEESCAIDLASADCGSCYAEECLPDYCECIGAGLDSDCGAP